MEWQYTGAAAELGYTNGEQEIDLRKRGCSTSYSESIIALSEWLKTPPGRYVVEWEQKQFDALVADVFGYNALQLGLIEMPSLRANRMPFIGVAGEANAAAEVAKHASANAEIAGSNDSGAEPPLVVTRLTELPFATQSTDLVVLPHALESSSDPHQILREVERILIPEGQVIISGFNPMSLWGARQAWGRASDTPFLPLAGSFLALPRLKDWLKLLSFEVNRGHFGCYRPPVRSEKWIERFRFAEKAGDRWWPICGAVYIISAVKRVRGIRLIGSWTESRPAVRALSPAVPSVANIENTADG